MMMIREPRIVSEDFDFGVIIFAVFDVSSHRCR